MKSKAINSLGYSGIVTLSRYVGQKKVKIAQFHNAGGTALFDFLAECLIGEVESAKAKRPAKVKLFYREQIDPNNEAAGYKYTSASGFIFLYQNAERNSNYSSQCRVTYTFQITRDQLESLTNFDHLCIGLYTNNASNTDMEVENYAAFCEISNVDASIKNSTLMVDWELVIANTGDKI